MKHLRPVIAIDGPAGSGKSTLAERLARELHLAYLNTGQMYRAVALEAHRRGLPPDDGRALAELAGSLRFELSVGTGLPALLIEGSPPRWDLATHEVETSVSSVSSHPEVREVLRAVQRRLGAAGAVVEGRDIGSVVFPDADVKLFLDASADVLASRRIEERTGRAPEDRGAEAPIAEALAARNAADARTTPFVPADDAVVLDTTGMSADEVFAAVRTVVLERLEDPSPPTSG
jgi:cytidylate kinase